MRSAVLSVRSAVQVKLYFMIGLPGELDEDVLGIAETISWLQQHCQGPKGPLEVHVTISNFTPKPHTPFQWHTVSTAEFERKQAMLREALGALPAVKALFTDVRLSAMEDFIARGDRYAGAVSLVIKGIRGYVTEADTLGLHSCGLIALTLESWHL